MFQIFNLISIIYILVFGESRVVRQVLLVPLSLWYVAIQPGIAEACFCSLLGLLFAIAGALGIEGGEEECNASRWARVECKLPFPPITLLGIFRTKLLRDEKRENERGGEIKRRRRTYGFFFLLCGVPYMYETEEEDPTEKLFFFHCLFLRPQIFGNIRCVFYYFPGSFAVDARRGPPHRQRQQQDGPLQRKLQGGRRRRRRRRRRRNQQHRGHHCKPKQGGATRKVRRK